MGTKAITLIYLKSGCQKENEMAATIIDKYEINKLIHDFDILQHPYFVIYNPDDEDVFKEAFEMISNCIFKSCEYVDKGNVLIVDRRKSEDIFLTY